MTGLRVLFQNFFDLQMLIKSPALIASATGDPLQSRSENRNRNNNESVTHFYNCSMIHALYIGFQQKCKNLNRLKKKSMLKSGNDLAKTLPTRVNN